MTKSLISIAGYDPSGGAGVLLDIAVFESLGFRGLGVLTAVTAQNAERVDRVFPLPAEAVTGQFGRLTEAAGAAGIKVGMLATAENVSAAARILAGNEHIPRVVDPVFRPKSGALLLEQAAWPRYLALFRGKADLITPNLDEAEVFTGDRVRTISEMRSAAAFIARTGRMPCLLKGGHLEGRPVDILCHGRKLTVFEHGRQARNVHGTGCFLASAILACLAEGRPLEEACRLGIDRVGEAIRSAVPARGGRWVFDLSRCLARPLLKGRKPR